MKKHIYKVLFVLCIPVLGMAQTVNQGILTVLPETDISTVESFSNEKDAAVKNDGSFYFYAHFNNDGLYSFDYASQKFVCGISAL